MADVTTQRTTGNERWLFFTLAFIAGFSSLELEILGTRIIGPVFGETSYVWTALITTTLLFLAAGYYLGGYLADKNKLSRASLAIVLIIVGAYIGIAPGIARPLLRALVNLDLITGPLIASAALFVIPMTLIGLIVPALVRLSTHNIGEVGTRAGRIYAIATIGSIVGAVITGFFLLPNAGLRVTTTITGILIILASLFLLQRKTQRRTNVASTTVISTTIVSLATLIIIGGVLAIPFIKPQSSEIVEEIPSFYATTILTDEGSGKSLYRGYFEISSINADGMEGNTYDDLYDVGFIINPSAKKVLLLGFGGGITAKQMLATYHDKSIEIVEIDSALIPVANNHFGWNGRAPVAIDDARHYLATHGEYDIIIVDFALQDSTKYFSTQEFFELARNHLSQNGLLFVLTPGSFEGEYKGMLNTVILTATNVFNDYLVLSVAPRAGRESFLIYPLLFSKQPIDTERLKNENPGSHPTIGESYADIIDNARSFAIDRTGTISTDDYPVYEKEYLAYLEQYRRRFLPYHVNNYIP